MSLEEKVGKLKGHVEDIKDDIKVLFDKIQKNKEDIEEKLTLISSQSDYEQKQIKEYLKSIDLKIAGIKQPCADVEIIKDKIKTHLEGHEEKHRNNLTKAGLFAAFITLFFNLLGFAWGKIIKFFVWY